MLKIEMNGFTDNSKDMNGTENNVKRRTENKVSGMFVYVKHAMIGAIIAVASFSTAMAVQPVSDDTAAMKYTPSMVKEATETDLRILMPYMDEEIINQIDLKSYSPGEVVALYIQKDKDFIPVVEDYFKK